jgi:hypothetical protein
VARAAVVRSGMACQCAEVADVYLTYCDSCGSAGSSQPCRRKMRRAVFCPDAKSPGYPCLAGSPNARAADALTSREITQFELQQLTRNRKHASVATHIDASHAIAATSANTTQAPSLLNAIDVLRACRLR